MMTTRKWEKRQPSKMTPAYIRSGFYLSLTDYARSIGVTRLTAYNRVQKGEVDVVRVGPKTVLIKITNKK